VLSIGDILNSLKPNHEQASFPKTHAIHVLRALLPPHLRPNLDSEVENRLTRNAMCIMSRSSMLGGNGPTHNKSDKGAELT
jgi:hypothetical protein